MSNLSVVGSLSGSLQYGAIAQNDYDGLLHKPQINGVELSGDKTFEELGLVACTNDEVDAIINS